MQQCTGPKRRIWISAFLMSPTQHNISAGLQGLTSQSDTSNRGQTLVNWARFYYAVIYIVKIGLLIKMSILTILSVMKKKKILCIFMNILFHE